jgi:hypothetical protein
MRKNGQLSEFETSREDQKRVTPASLSALEKAATEAALNRCVPSRSGSSATSAMGRLNILSTSCHWRSFRRRLKALPLSSNGKADARPKSLSPKGNCDQPFGSDRACRAPWAYSW